MIEAPRIVLVEDDHLQAGLATESLIAGIQEAQVTVIATEHGFRTEFPHLVGYPPNLVISDMLVRWYYPKVDIPEIPEPPEDITTGGHFFTAGFRIQRLLANHPATENMPVILWSVLPLENLIGLRSASDSLEGVYFLQKKRSFENSAAMLAKNVKRILEGGIPEDAVRLSAFDTQPPVATHQR